MYKFIESPNYNKGRKAGVDSIVIHYTSGGSLSGSVSWFKNPKAKASAHYIISRDGEVVQMVRDEDTAWHAGRSELDGRPWVNRFSIGIELVNWGVLEKREDKLYCWPGNYTREYDVKEFGHPVFIDGKWWAPYHESQLEACTKLCQELRQKYPNITDDRVVGHMDISPGRKRDPGPLFPLKELASRSSPVLPDDVFEDDVPELELQELQGDRDDRPTLMERVLMLFGRL